MSLPAGKVPIKILKNVVFRYLGAHRSDVVMGPSIGEDAALVKVGRKLVVISGDPVTGAVEKVGWLAVHVNANDVASRGIRPLWFVSCILLPEHSRKNIVQKICRQIDRAARELNVAVIRGHSEVTPGLLHPVVIGCILGLAERGKYVTSGGAKPQDKIILTKGVGIEGTAILASDRRRVLNKVFGKEFTTRAEMYFNQISVVKDALVAYRTGGVTAMHDPTEGGISCGLHELADASNVGFRVFEDKIIVNSETRAICDFFKVDPLQLISSGALIIIASPEKSEKIIQVLSNNEIQSAIIGEIVEARSGRILIRKDGTETRLPRPVSDPLWSALTRKI
jgi:hydrogenase expression/formation protein HypE